MLCQKTTSYQQPGRTIQKAVCRPFTRSPMPEQCAPFLHCSRISMGLHGVPSRCAQPKFATGQETPSLRQSLPDCQAIT